MHEHKSHLKYLSSLILYSYVSSNTSECEHIMSLTSAVAIAIGKYCQLEALDEVLNRSFMMLLLHSQKVLTRNLTKLFLVEAWYDIFFFLALTNHRFIKCALI